MVRRLLIPVLMCAAAAFAAGVAAGAASATIVARAARVSTLIVPFRSVGGFGLGLTPAQVKRRLGRASQTIHVGGKIAQLAYYKPGLSFGFDSLQPSDPANQVAAIQGGDIRFRTSKGIRLGSSERAVRRAYPALKCAHGLCSMWQGPAGGVGSRYTGFTFFQGKVDSIDIQKVYE
jgi:hypothetical protein